LGAKADISTQWLIVRCPTLELIDFADMIEPLYSAYAVDAPTEMLLFRARYFDLDTLAWARQATIGDPFIAASPSMEASLMSAKRTYSLATHVVLE
jgi:hypothetical protein